MFFHRLEEIFFEDPSFPLGLCIIYPTQHNASTPDSTQDNDRKLITHHVQYVGYTVICLSIIYHIKPPFFKHLIRTRAYYIPFL